MSIVYHAVMCLEMITSQKYIQVFLCSVSLPLSRIVLCLPLSPGYTVLWLLPVAGGSGHFTLWSTLIYGSFPWDEWLGCRLGRAVGCHRMTTGLLGYGHRQQKPFLSSVGLRELCCIQMFAVTSDCVPTPTNLEHSLIVVDVTSNFNSCY